MRSNGDCDAGYAPLRERFDRNLTEGRDHGAALAVAVEGELVVDLWGGSMDAAGARAWDRDSLVVVKSVSKGLTAICGNMCIDRGLLDPEAPVARYWPEFAAGGKETVLVQHVFDHRAGLPDIPGFGREQYGDWDAACTALAALTPQWEPGRAHAYHSATFGWLVGELVRRVSGKRPNMFLQDEVCRPLGVEAWIGAPPDIDDRIAEIVPSDPLPLDRRAEVPASNGFTNARNLARIFGVLACRGEHDGVRLLSEQTIRDATASAVTGPHAFPVPDVLEHIRFARGFQLSSSTTYMGPNPHAFGHAGAGGSIAWADPERRLAFAYTPNRFDMDLDHMYDRANELSHLLIDCNERG